MKVTLVSTFEQTGGAAIACKRLNKALNMNGVGSRMLVQNRLAETNAHIAYLRTWDQKFSKIRLAVEVFKNLKVVKNKDHRFAFSTASSGVDISSYQEIIEADIIHLHWVNQGFLSLRSLEKLAQLQKPIVWTLHDMWAFTGGCHHSRECTNYERECGHCNYLKRANPFDESHKVWEKKKQIYAQMNLKVVTCSQWLANCAKASSLLQGVEVQVIPNPLDVLLYKVAQDKSSVRAKHQLPQDKFILSMSAYNVTDPRKGFEYLQEALSILKNKNPDVADRLHLVLIGENKNPSAIQLPVSYTLTGYINNADIMEELYQASDVFVLPSLEENLPNTIMEAMACGIPSLAFDVGGISDLIDHKENGYLAQYLSKEDLAEGVLWLYNQTNSSAELAMMARKKVEEKFDLSIVSTSYINLYKSVLKA